MLHYHVLIVGTNWLLHKSVIQYAWVHYGGGPVLDIHTVKKEVAKDDVLDALAAAVTAKWVKCMVSVRTQRIRKRL